MGLRGPNARPLRGRARPPARNTAKPGRPSRSRAQAVISFIESLTITAGLHAGRRFTLRDWQRALIGRWYATDAAGHRIVRQAVLSCGRKNGKTSLLASLVCAHLVGPEVERRGQLVAAAATREQASVLFNEVVAFLDASPYRDRVNIQTHLRMVTDLESRTTFRALPSDARVVHGLSPSLVVIDELGVWGTGKGRQLVEALTTATGARKEPFIVTISTQSADDHSLMSELIDLGKQISDGTIENPAFAATLYEVPAEVDPFDEATWALANPALGDFKSLEDMRAAATLARQIPASLASFRNLHLNQRVHAEGRWLSVDAWDACRVDDLGPLAGRVAYIGIDIAAKIDLTALVVLMPNDLGGGYDLIPEFFLPGDMVDALAAKARAPYRLWAEQGHLTLTSGNVFDPSHLLERLHAWGKLLDVQAAGVDPWSTKGLLPRWVEEGIPALEVRQNLPTLTGPAKELERLILAGLIRHTGSPVMRWNIGNVIVTSDAAGNILPDKEKSGAKIDGVTAAITALERALTAHSPDSYYEAHRLIVI